MSTACYALRYVKCSFTIETLQIIYFAHIHTIMTYSVIFWGNSSYAKKVFILKKSSDLLQILDQGTLVGKSSGMCK